MGLGAIPAGWRFDRGMVPVVMPDGWLIHIEHPDSISTIERMMSDELATLGVRQLTTAIATRLHRVILDTGSRPFGIHFGSKHGAGWCKALWLDHPDASNIITLSPEPILVTDNSLKTAADRFRIRNF